MPILNLNFNNLIMGFTFPSFGQIVMILVAGVLIYQAVYHKHKPLLLLPMGIGILASNLPFPYMTANVVSSVLGFMLKGIESGAYPVLVLFAIGTMVDLGLLIADPKNFIIGAMAQVGVFIVFFLMAIIAPFLGNVQSYAATSIVGLADGNLSMYITALIAPERLAALIIASYSYAGLLPILQPRITKFLTTKEERKINMPYLRHVSRGEKIIFACVSMALCGIFLANAFPLIGAFMFGNILRESDIIKSFSSNIQKSLTSILTVVMGIAVGATATAGSFLRLDTAVIFLFGFLSLMLTTGIGIMTAKIINIFTGKTNPIIGSAGLSAFPAPSWSAHIFGQEAMSSNCLLLHAMAVNTAGIISGAFCVGIFLTVFH